VSAGYRFTEREAEICWRLLNSLQRRGTDAWGYFDGSRVHKEPGPFYMSPKYDTLVDELLEAETNIFLCHTRLATKGDPQENKNNHPFTLGDFVFAHNGVLYQTDPFDNPWSIETDSFWMLYWIWYEYGRLGDVAEAIRVGVSHVSGTYACWLHKRAEARTYLYRIMNPLVETHTWRGRGMVVFGSDRLSIMDALAVPGLVRRLRFLAPDVKILKQGTIYTVKDGVLEEDGVFEPRRMMRQDLIDFEARYGHLRRYHLPLGGSRP
jgi:glucosamine 6-phosphate synthetase-like amidotransferase/phosphosugar isomerase protein